MAIRRKKISETRGVKLFLEDEQELVAKVKRGTYKNITDAIRNTISIQLTAERLEKYGDDAVSARFKKKQLEVLEPIDKNLTNINNELQLMRDELAETRKLNRDLTESIRGLKRGGETDEYTRGKLEKLDKMFGEFGAVLNYVRTLLIHIRQDNFIIRGMMLFFNLGYTAGKIKLTKRLDEPVMVKTIQAAGKEVIAKARERIMAGEGTDGDDYLVREFAQALMTDLWKLGQDTETNP